MNGCFFKLKLNHTFTASWIQNTLWAFWLLCFYSLSLVAFPDSSIANLKQKQATYFKYPCIRSPQKMVLEWLPSLGTLPDLISIFHRAFPIKTAGHSYHSTPDNHWHKRDRIYIFSHWQADNKSVHLHWASKKTRHEKVITCQRSGSESQSLTLCPKMKTVPWEIFCDTNEIHPVRP